MMQLRREEETSWVTTGHPLHVVSIYPAFATIPFLGVGTLGAKT